MRTPYVLTEEDKERQGLREYFGRDAGLRRVRNRERRELDRGQPSDSAAPRVFLEDHFPRFLIALQTWYEARQHQRGPRHVVEQFIKRTDLETVAYIAFKTTLDQALIHSTRTLAAKQIARRIVHEQRFRLLREQAPALFRYQMTTHPGNNYSFIAQGLDRVSKIATSPTGEKLKLPPEPTESSMLACGVMLINLLMETYPDFVQLQRKGGAVWGRAPYVLMLSDETQAWLLKKHEYLGLCHPVTSPMVIPPAEWGPHKRGGYRYDMKQRFPLTRSPFYSRAREAERMPTVYGALNTLQATAWRINPHVYEVVTELLRSQPAWADSLQWFDLKPPTKPKDIATNPETRKTWKRAAHLVRRENHRRGGFQLTARITEEIAKGLIEEAAFFFPYSLDFRGRIYPIAEYLHPQGDDLSRSLLLFSEGKPLDADGARWLAIHGANCLGERDGWKAATATLDERVQWIHDHSEQIEQAGADPFTHHWWLEADEPFQFLAFCIEWMQFIKANEEDKEYVCGLPISMDGSCNGLQHFCAMWRDEEGAEAVNVVPTERPQDIYQRVAARVVGELEKQLDNPIATRLLSAGIVTRKLCKRPTMTFGYGSKRFGFNRQIVQYFKETDWAGITELLTFPDEAGAEPTVHIKDAAMLLAGLIWEALGEEVSKAQEGMRWMQDCARLILRAGKGVQWRAPSGLLVTQEYFKMRDQLTFVKTVAMGKLLVRYRSWTEKPDPTRQVNAISPNVVHSLDASVLMETVLQAARAGIGSFAMVHDSFGTVPSDCAKLARITREVFARFYEQDIVGQLYEQFKAQAPDCPPPPAHGTLEIKRVLESVYFFA